MNRHFTYNFETKTIVGSQASIKRANERKNPEYIELTQMLAAQPTFTVTAKTIEHKKNKKTHKNLTIDRMREYIKLQENSKQKLLEFDYVLKLAEAKGAKYPIAKKWFLDVYPEFRVAKDEEDAVAKTEAFNAAAASLAALDLSDIDLNETEETDIEEAA